MNAGVGLIVTELLTPINFGEDLIPKDFLKDTDIN